MCFKELSRFVLMKSGWQQKHEKTWNDHHIFYMFNRTIRLQRYIDLYDFSISIHIYVCLPDGNCWLHGFFVILSTISQETLQTSNNLHAVTVDTQPSWWWGTPGSHFRIQQPFPTTVESQKGWQKRVWWLVVAVQELLGQQTTTPRNVLQFSSEALDKAKQTSENIKLLSC